MLENTDTLLSLAEVAAAFAGFAALVSVIPRGSDRSSTPAHDILRLRLVIASGVAGVAAALLPVGVSAYGPEPDVVWRVSAVGFLILDYGVMASFVTAYTPVRGTFPPDRLAVVVVTALEVIEQGGLLAVILGLGPFSPSAIYVTALIANICQAGFVFVRFIGSAFQHGPAE